MTDVIVPLEDALAGRLPGVCVKDGIATTDRLEVCQPAERRPEAAVFLVVLGPLLYSIMSALRETITVEIPMSSTAYARLRAARRLARTSLVAAISCGLGLVFAAPPALQDGAGVATRLLGIALLIGLLTALAWRLAGSAQMRDCTVMVRRDREHTQLTISRVHPAFAAACAAQFAPEPPRV